MGFHRSEIFYRNAKVSATARQRICTSSTYRPGNRGLEGHGSQSNRGLSRTGMRESAPGGKKAVKGDR